MYLSADDILSAEDLGYEDVPVPEWGGTVRVCGLSGTERDRFEARMMNDKGSTDPSKMGDNFRARLAVACIVDSEGKQLFRGEAMVKRLGEKSGEALQRVCDVAMRLSGMTEADESELVGN